MTETDLELLARYTRQHAEDAFAEIVRRYIDLVHSVAIRQVRSSQFAEEVAQTTFIALARDAHRLAPDTILAGWLYKVAHRTSANVVRREARRQLREQTAMEMNATNAPDIDWTHIEPLLDEAMRTLDDTDRNAVLLRYFQKKSLTEVGAALETSANAAQKRLTRAVERLRQFFAKRGIRVGATGLVVALSANSVQAAPLSLAVTVTAAAKAASVSTPTLPLINGALKIMVSTKVKILATAVIIATLTGVPLAVRHFTNRRSHAGATDSPSLNQQTTTGAATPEAGLQRLVAAAKADDISSAINYLSWQRSQNVPEATVDQLKNESFTRNTARSLADVDKIRIVSQKAETGSAVRTRVESIYPNGTVKQAELRFVLENGEWKPSVNITRSDSGSFGVTFLLPLTPELGPVAQ
jgi:RNA polymerase sigma factor (sigma-70 family)